MTVLSAVMRSGMFLGWMLVMMVSSHRWHSVRPSFRFTQSSPSFNRHPLHMTINTENNNNPITNNSTIPTATLSSFRQSTLSELLVPSSFALAAFAYVSLGATIVLNANKDEKRYTFLHEQLFGTYLKPDMRILEVGFGPSGVNINKGYYPRGVTVVGLDPLLATYPPLTPRISEYSTTTTTSTTITDAERVYQQQATTAMDKHGVHLSGLVQGKAEDLPFADASFDAVVTTLVLCTVTNPSLAIAEIIRVLKPMGVYVCVEHILADSSEPFRDVQPYKNTGMSAGESAGVGGSAEGGVRVGGDIAESGEAGIREGGNEERETVRTLPANEWLAIQQKALDPLQELLANGCHLNRRTDTLLLKPLILSSSPPLQPIASSSSSSSSSTSQSLTPLSVIYEDFPSQWPISRQMFATFRKK